jgi:hypothetical protein
VLVCWCSVVSGESPVLPNANEISIPHSELLTIPSGEGLKPSPSPLPNPSAWSGERYLNKEHIQFLGKSDGVFDGFFGFHRESQNLRSMYRDAGLVTGFGEAPHLAVSRAFHDAGQKFAQFPLDLGASVQTASLSCQKLAPDTPPSSTPFSPTLHKTRLSRE